MPRYVVFLRAVNVGGNNKVAMAALKKWLAAEGFTDVETRGASGNVLLTSTARSSEAVRAKVAAVLAARMKKDIVVAVRSGAEMKALVASAPFKGDPKKGERFCVTLLPGRDVFTHIKDVVPGKAPDFTKDLGKEERKVATTRFWNVVRALADDV